MMKACPLSGIPMETLREFEHHVAGHLQELALFAFPKQDPIERPGETSNPFANEVKNISTEESQIESGMTDVLGSGEPRVRQFLPTG